MRALEAFPPGHPSSPYLADGTRRPPCPSLRSLELPMPDEWKDSGERPSEASQPDQSGGGAWKDTREHPQEASQSDQSHDEGAQGHDPVKQGTADNIFGRSHDLPNSDAPRQPEVEHHWYWTEVPRFTRMWADHVNKWPADRQPMTNVDRSRDSPGSWRSDSNLPLNPVDHSRTEDAIGEVHTAEPRVTEDLQRVVQVSAFGGELVGLEFCRKGEDRLKEKVAEKLRNEPDRAPEEVVRGIHDAIRYTVRVDSKDYFSGYTDVSRRLEKHGYTMFHCKNQWRDPEYKGINTRWVTPEGLRFEIQFHTPESHYAKQEVTHAAYERIRNRLTTDSEREELEAFQREVSSWIPVPEGASDIPDHRKEHF